MSGRNLKNIRIVCEISSADGASQTLDHTLSIIIC